MKSIQNWIVGGLLLILCVGCRKELCYDHTHDVRTLHFDFQWSLDWKANADMIGNNIGDSTFYIHWERVMPPVPQGVRLLLTDEENKSSKSNFGNETGVINVSSGLYDLLFYNNDTEYILFDDNGSSQGLTATTRSRTMTMRGGESRNIDYNNQPDWLFISAINGLSLPFIAETLDEDRDVFLDVPMQPVVYSYVIRFNITGCKYVKSGNGFLTGMVGKVALNTGKSIPENVVTLAFEDVVRDENGVTAYIRSFGYEQGCKSEVTLQVYLADGNYKTFVCDVTEQMELQPKGGILVVDGLEVQIDESTSGGFDVTTNDWEHENIELPID